MSQVDEHMESQEDQQLQKQSSEPSQADTADDQDKDTQEDAHSQQEAEGEQQESEDQQEAEAEGEGEGEGEEEGEHQEEESENQEKGPSQAEGEGQQEDDKNLVKEAEGEEQETEEKGETGGPTEEAEESEGVEEAEGVEEEGEEVEEAEGVDGEGEEADEEAEGEESEDEDEEIDTQLTIENNCPIQRTEVYKKRHYEEVSKVDIPERLQEVLERRIKTDTSEIKKETEFIYHLLLTQFGYKKSKALQESVNKILNEMILNHSDIPFIFLYRSYIFSETLTEEDLWRISELDLKWVEYKRIEQQLSVLLSKIPSKKVKDEFLRMKKNHHSDISFHNRIMYHLRYKLSYYKDSYDFSL